MKRNLVLLALVALVATTGVAAERAFRGQIISVDPPPQYTVHEPPAQPPRGSMFVFVGPARADGTRPNVQVTLMELPPEQQTGDTFAKAMIDGVARRRAQWKVATTDVLLGKVKAKRYAWSGVESRRGITMRGVMYAGVSGGVGFSLHVQDLDKYAGTSLPAGEGSMKTFRVRTAK